MAGLGPGYTQLSNAISNMGKGASLAPLTKQQAYNDTLAALSTAGKNEVDAAKTLMEIEGLKRSQNITPEDIYAALGGGQTPGLTAEQSLSPDVLDVSQIQQQDTRPDLRTRANTISTLHDLGGGNIQQIMEAMGGQQKVALGDELLTGQRETGDVARVMAALKGQDLVKMSDGVAYDPFGSGKGAQVDSGAMGAVDASYGPGTWKKLNVLQRTLIAQDPSIIDDPQMFQQVADVLSRSDVIKLIGDTPGAQLEMMKRFRSGGIEGVLQYVQSISGTQKPADNDPFGLR